MNRFGYAPKYKEIHDIECYEDIPGSCESFSGRFNVGGRMYSYHLYLDSYDGPGWYCISLQVCDIHGCGHDVGVGTCYYDTVSGNVKSF